MNKKRKKLTKSHSDHYNIADKFIVEKFMNAENIDRQCNNHTINQKISPEQSVNPIGFQFLRKKQYTCGKQTYTIEEYLHTATNIEFSLIPKGDFYMGSNDSKFSKPVRKGSITKSYLMAKYPCTEEQWENVMKDTKITTPHAPIVQISWDQCIEFCKKTGLQLPNEIQWEYACRAGSTTRWSFGDNMADLTDYAWVKSNSNKQIQEVGLKKPNAFGLYDMHGNIWEWCEDIWKINYHESKEIINPLAHTIRGGSFNFPSLFSTSAARSYHVKYNYHIGFRVSYYDNTF
ncbi:MAG: formylglycine-generating enzyme family protein [Planctomycetes bacterium]|jgi:formylglycine-generating enzyme required for sulfatase activity|nr:formylglycine-generating enzyme family protein [Planctomycetota bacterium]